MGQQKGNSEWQQRNKKGESLGLAEVNCMISFAETVAAAAKRREIFCRACERIC